MFSFGKGNNLPVKFKQFNLSKFQDFLMVKLMVNSFMEEWENFFQKKIQPDLRKKIIFERVESLLFLL